MCFDSQFPQHSQDRVAIHAIQNRLGIKQIDLAWPPIHKELNDIFRFGSVMVARDSGHRSELDRFR